MTCLEKFYSEYPESSFFVSGCRIPSCNTCPHLHNIMDKPNNCCKEQTPGKGTIVCSDCWNREISESPIKIVNGSIYKLDEEFDTDNPNDMWTKESPPRILDSGNRRHFESGAVRDICDGKGRCDLLPLDIVGDCLFIDDCVGGSILLKINKFQEDGDISHLYDSIYDFNHIHRWGVAGGAPEFMYTMLLEVSIHFEEGAKKYGDNNWRKGIPVRCYIDSAVRHYLKWLRGDEDEPHDRAFCWNILCAIWTAKHKPELNDYATKENKNENS